MSKHLSFNHLSHFSTPIGYVLHKGQLDKRGKQYQKSEQNHGLLSYEISTLSNGTSAHTTLQK